MGVSYVFNPFTGNFDSVSLVSVGDPANGLSISDSQELTLDLASTSDTGALSSDDWNTFNDKQPAGDYITALTGDGTAAGPGSAALTLATVNSTVGSFGTPADSGTFTVNAKGLITAAASVPIQIAESQVTNLVSDLAGKQPTGNYITALTGDATASGPGSAALTLATVNLGVGTWGSASHSPVFTVNAKGLITAATDINIQIAESQVTNLVSDLAGKQATGNYITALTGDATASGPGSAALTLATVNSNVGAFGGSAVSAILTVNAKGLVTAASSTAIQIAESQVTNLVSDLAGKQATGNYITALIGDATASGPGSAALTLATVNSNVGSFGTASAVGTFTVNAKGLITAASSTNISLPFSQVTGTVPLNQGGTGQTTKGPAFDALSPTTTEGDMEYRSATTNVRLPAGSMGQYLGVVGSSSPNPVPSFVPFLRPAVTRYTSGSSTHNITFVFLCSSANATAGATYTNNSGTFTVKDTISAGTILYTSGGSVPQINGTLTKTGGTGDSTITFTAYRVPIYTIVEAIGGGGGGGGSGTAAGTAAGVGGTTTFGSLITATGGGLGAWTPAAGPGLFGTGTAVAPAITIAAGCGSGNAGSGFATTGAQVGGKGGDSPLGGGGIGPGGTNAGTAGGANTGGGGGGAGSGNGGPGAGGGSGGYIKALVPYNFSSYPYATSIGAGGTAGGAGTGTAAAGGAGGSGVIIAYDYFQ